MSKEEYDKDNFVHRMLLDIQKAQLEHRAVTDNIQAEVKFLRARVFQIDEEDEFGAVERRLCVVN